MLLGVGPGGASRKQLDVLGEDFHVFDAQLRVDDFQVPRGIDSALDMRHVGVLVGPLEMSGYGDAYCRGGRWHRPIGCG